MMFLSISNHSIDVFMYMNPSVNDTNSRRVIPKIEEWASNKMESSTHLTCDY